MYGHYKCTLKIFTSPLAPTPPLLPPPPPTTPLDGNNPGSPSAQLSSLATLPIADRQLREPALLNKRATVEAWLTREANTLQKYRLVRRECVPTERKPRARALPRVTPPLSRSCAGLGGEAPENTAAVEEAADHHSG